LSHAHGGIVGVKLSQVVPSQCYRRRVLQKISVFRSVVELIFSDLVYAELRSRVSDAGWYGQGESESQS